MRPVGLAILAVIVCAAPAWAQNSEMENFTAGANQLSEAQREVTQRNIDIATQALRAKDYARARKYAQPVTRADPKRIEAWLLLGTAQLGLQDWKRARITYAAALRVTPGHPEARAGLGVAMARTNDPKARTQLAWLDAKVRECGGCGQAAKLAKFKADVETAIAEAARATPTT